MMISIIISLLVVALNIQLGSQDPKPAAPAAPAPAAAAATISVDVTKAAKEKAIDGLYTCIEGATGKGQIPKERVEYWKSLHPLNFVTETLVRELPAIYHEDVFKTFLRNQATAMIACLELCRSTIHGYDDDGLQKVLKQDTLVAQQIIADAKSNSKLIEESIPYFSLYETLRGNLKHT